MKCEFFSALAMFCLILSWTGHGQALLSEFQAANRTLTDEDGTSSDWIELCNPTQQPVGLEGWFLTDDRANPAKWQFPATNLGPGQFLVVFASNKDRRLPGRPLHTNFKLSTEGEYLALVRPDGITRATEFGPAYPAQVDDVSYGFPWTSQTVPLLSAGAAGRLLVPGDGRLGTNWVWPDFDDSAWTGVQNGTDLESVTHGLNSSVYLRLPFTVTNLAGLDQLTLQMRYDDGFVACLNGVEIAWRNAPVAATGGVQADSTADWSGADQQGAHSWFYGFYNQAADPDGVYDPVTDFKTVDLQWNWNGGAWVLGPSNPPWDMIAASSWQPNGDNSGGVHWVIRRWRSPISGLVTCHLTFAKENTACGSGSTVRVLLNGVPQFSRTLAYNDRTGIRTDVVLPNIQAGDLIDFALDPLGTDGASNDLCDASTFSVVIEQSPSAGLDWNSAATAVRTVEAISQPEEFDLTRYKDLLVAGTNVLAVHGLNASTDALAFILQAELSGTYRQIRAGQPVYFTTVTPGAANGSGSSTIGPIISHVAHTPAMPSAGEDLLVRARVTPTFHPVGSVLLKYRVQFGAESVVTMQENGAPGEGGTGGVLLAGRIPGSGFRAGQMIRYCIGATDDEGRQTRLPAFAEPARSPQYYGTVVQDPVLTNSRLPVLHWFIQNPRSAESDLTARCSVFFDGEFYDNIGINLHGQSTRGFPKKSYDLEFNPGSPFRWSPNAPRVDDLNLLTTWADKSYLRNVLAHETYRDAGAPSHFALAVRVQQNGAFHSVANLVENGGSDFLKRLGLDPNGALYKMYNSAESVAGAEKKTRKDESRADLQDVISGMGQADAAARQTFMFDNLDLPEIVDFLAAKMITADTDCCHKNYYLYRDSDGTGQWQAMPWDVDLSFGRVWTCAAPCLNYFDERIYTNQSIFVGENNRIFSAIYNTPATRQMFLRRLRTLMDTLLRPPGTSPSNDLYRLKTLALLDQTAPDAALDLAKWGTWGTRETITQAVQRIWTEFLPGRRAYLFKTLLVSNRGEIPLSQPTNATLAFGEVEFRAASGDPLQEWLSITNANSYAMDLSGWRLEDGVRFTFKPGTVLPAHSDLIVSPSIKAFLARTVSPKGGERRLVTGPYQGNLSAWGESLALLDPSGRRVSATTFSGNPSPAQESLRITEIMFNPTPWLADTNIDAQQFEFIELRNIGLAPLNLRGVRFTGGIQFDFAAGGVADLAPGARVLVVKSTNAFTLRYGPGFPVAGQFAGSLDNAGERLQLEDAFGEEILDFSYDPEWYPTTDGQGFSLAVLETALLSSPDYAASQTNWCAARSTPGFLNNAIALPLANKDGLLVPENESAAVRLADLLRNDADPGGGTVEFDGVSPLSDQGSSLIRSGDELIYTPLPDFEGVDRFGYTVVNDQGAKASGVVDVLVYTGPLPQPGSLCIIWSAPGYRLRYAGTPGQTCEWQASPDLLHWDTLALAAIPPHGVVEYREPAAPLTRAYYRALSR